jgi:cytochrome c556
MSHLRRFAIAAAVLAASSAALAAGLTGAAAVKDRQQHMKALGAAAKAIGEQFHSGKPDLAVVQAEAAKIDAAAPELSSWFPRGSGPEAGVKTEALPLIWSDPSGFAAKAHALATAAHAFDAAVGAHDPAAIAASGPGLGAACKGCHETYRAKEKI